MWLAWRFVTDGGEYDEASAPRVVGVVLVLSGMFFLALLVRPPPPTHLPLDGVCVLSGPGR
jgi:hypothetical protein